MANWTDSPLDMVGMIPNTIHTSARGNDRRSLTHRRDALNLIGSQETAYPAALLLGDLRRRGRNSWLKLAVSLKPSGDRLVVLTQGGTRMTVAHYRINELDAADRVVDGYSVMCRSDTAALAMASTGAENRAAAVEVWENTRHVARLDPVSPWHRLRGRWTGQPVG